MSSWLFSCSFTADSELTAGVYVIVSPSLVNRPRFIATKNPAESMAGTTPTLSVVFSGVPKFVGRLLSIEPMVLPPTTVLDEQPAASAATAVSAPAHATRPHVPLPANRTPHLKLYGDHPCQGRISQRQIIGRLFRENRTICGSGQARAGSC